MVQYNSAFGVSSSSGTCCVRKGVSQFFWVAIQCTVIVGQMIHNTNDMVCDMMRYLDAVTVEATTILCLEIVQYSMF